MILYDRVVVRLYAVGGFQIEGIAALGPKGWLHAPSPRSPELDRSPLQFHTDRAGSLAARLSPLTILLAILRNFNTNGPPNFNSAARTSG
jgi:hypothetical protein